VCARRAQQQAQASQGEESDVTDVRQLKHVGTVAGAGLACQERRRSRIALVLFVLD